MRSRFDEEMALLHRELTRMGALCEEAIALTAQALDGDRSLAAKAPALEGEIDQMERDIENHCLSLLLRQQPVARDLRTISTALKMVTDLQRIGDQAANIAELSLLLAKQGRAKVPEHIGTMSRKTGIMVSQAIAAYTDRDVELAHAVINLDDEVDDLFAAVKAELIDRILANRDDADAAIDLIIIAKYLERVADHAVNIAQWAVFCVTGQL